MRRARRRRTVSLMPDEIIIGFDGSASSYDALALGRALADAERRPLIVACVYLRDPYYDHMRDENPDKQEAEQTLEQAMALLDGCPAEAVAVGSSTTNRGLHEFALERRAAAVVVGSTERSAIGRVVPGSTARHLLTGAPCAVAVAPRGFAGMPSLERIGVAFDGSKESRRALGVAGELAAASGTRIELVGAVMLPGAALGGSYAVTTGNRTFVDELLAPAREECAEALRSLPEPTRGRTRVEIGGAAQILIEVSEDLDLLVCGSRGYGRGRQVVLGSTSGYLVDHARCAVLVVPRERDDDPDQEPSRRRSRADRVAS